MYYSEIGQIIEAGLDRDKEKVRSFASLLAKKMEADGEIQTWTEIIRECRESGLSNREFCAQRGIGEKTYYYWLRKVREATAASAPHLVRLEESREAEPLCMIEIRYGEAELKLPEDVDLKAVAVFLNALRRHD